MAGIEMENVVLIALGLLIVVFVVNQYKPSFFSFMRREGFVNAMKAVNPIADKMANTPNTDKPVEKPLSEMTDAEKEEKEKKDKKEKDDAALMMKPVVASAPSKKGSKNGPNEGFADLSSYEGPASFGSAEAPAGCYPRDQLTPSELLPKDMNSIWAEQNPMGPGSLKGKNFLSAGALIGVNTVGQSLRNANLQIRSEPPNPQVPVSIFLQSTIGPDISHRSLEIN
jgi:hypothetical protein